MLARMQGLNATRRSPARWSARGGRQRKRAKRWLLLPLQSNGARATCWERHIVNSASQPEQQDRHRAGSGANHPARTCKRGGGGGCRGAPWAPRLWGEALCAQNKIRLIAKSPPSKLHTATEPDAALAATPRERRQKRPGDSPKRGDKRGGEPAEERATRGGLEGGKEAERPTTIQAPFPSEACRLCEARITSPANLQDLASLGPCGMHKDTKCKAFIGPDCLVWDTDKSERHPRRLPSAKTPQQTSLCCEQGHLAQVARWRCATC